MTCVCACETTNKNKQQTTTNNQQNKQKQQTTFRTWFSVSSGVVVGITIFSNTVSKSDELANDTQNVVPVKTMGI
jgi:hypothetical protein